MRQSVPVGATLWQRLRRVSVIGAGVVSMLVCVNEQTSAQITEAKAWRSLGQITLQSGDCGVVRPIVSCEEMSGYRFEVQRGSVTDTLGPITTDEPWLLSDFTLLLPWIVEVRHSFQVELRLYNSRSGELKVVDVPEDWDPVFAWPVWLPSGRLMAYDVLAEEGGVRLGTRLVVRKWGGWQLVAKSPVIEGCSDAGVDAYWSTNGQYIVWHPPHCEYDTPELDSLRIKVPPG
ncbi:MAG: hypothetical protein ACE5HM_07485 [Acidiferrobacterales bacterium]